MEPVGLSLLPPGGRAALLPLSVGTWIKVSFLIFFFFVCVSSWSDVVLLTGSLKRPAASRPTSGHLRVLHSPLSSGLSGLNPEGIYV